MPRLQLPHRDLKAGRRRRGWAWLIFGAALYAAAELAAGLLFGRFFDWGRAEALLFLAFRPWLLLIAAMRMAELPWRRRFLLYLLALFLAGLSESSLLLALGSSSPWPEMLRGWAAGASVALVFDVIIQAGRRFAGRRGKLAATILLAVALLAPAARWPFETIVLGPAQSTPDSRPPLLVMTSLPIVWGEGGPFDPASRPAASWKALEFEFTLQPIDAIGPQSIGNLPTMLIAQPRLLAPEELVALDSWVRAGGGLLVLADPALVWPTALPPGDIRRPVETNMLTPLLAHWGVEIRPPTQIETEDVFIGDETVRRLRMIGKGLIQVSGTECRLRTPFIASCRIGRGRALVVADADLLSDSTSMAPPNVSIERHNRLSDNLPAIADWLDELGQVDRPPMDAVQWARPGVSRTRALLMAALPILVALLLALLLAGPLSRNSPTYPQAEAFSIKPTSVRTKQE